MTPMLGRHQASAVPAASKTLQRTAATAPTRRRAAAWQTNYQVQMMSIQRGGMTGMTPTLTDGSMPCRAADVVTTAQRSIADNDRFCRLIRFLCSQRPWHNKSHCMPWLQTMDSGTIMIMLRKYHTVTTSRTQRGIHAAAAASLVLPCSICRDGWPALPQQLGGTACHLGDPAVRQSMILRKQFQDSDVHCIDASRTCTSTHQNALRPFNRTFAMR
jgi:hypothetical protein